MSRTWIVFCLFVAAVLCGVAFLAISAETVVPIVARGVGPSGVQVTSSGWLALLTSLLGAGGFTLAGLVTAIASRFVARKTAAQPLPAGTPIPTSDGNQTRPGRR